MAENLQETSRAYRILKLTYTHTHTQSSKHNSSFANMWQVSVYINPCCLTLWQLRTYNLQPHGSKHIDTNTHSPTHMPVQAWQWWAVAQILVNHRWQHFLPKVTKRLAMRRGRTAAMAETHINCGAMLIYILIVIGLTAHKCHGALKHHHSTCGRH